jgi:hypothetical protein
MRHDLSWGIAAPEAGRRRDERSKEAKQGGVGVNVMERGAMVDLGEVVEDVCV